MVSKGLTFNKMYELLEKGTCLLKASEKYRGNMVENENYDLQVALACALIASTASVVIKVKKKKRFWVQPYLQQRQLYGSHIATVNALLAKDPYYFRRNLRLSSDVYEVILLID